MIICKIWDADYPWDVRVEKICGSLTKKNEVHLVCRNSLCRPRYEYVDSLHIHRLPCLPKQYGPLNRVLGFPAFFNPLWIYSIWRVARTAKIDLILVRDLPLALTALIVGRLLKVPVVLDMAENYPAMMQDLQAMTPFGIQTLINGVVRNPAFVRAVERVAIHAVDHILVVVEEARDRLVGMGVPPSRISLVINTPTCDRLDSSPESRLPGVSPRQDSLTLIYLGLLEPPRGLDTVIAGMERLRDRSPNLRLRIIGSGRDAERLHAMVREKGLMDRVEFLGWIDYKYAIRHIHEADIGLVPHHATESWNTTIPNKLFDYMSMGKPVIVSNAKPVERIVREVQCGVVFREQDPDDLARAILTLESESVKAAMGRRGKDAVARKYNWAVDEQRLFQALEIVVGMGRS